MDWQVVDGYIKLNKAETEERIQALLDEYVQLAYKNPARTPEEILNILRVTYDPWLRAVDPSVTDEFIQRLDKKLISMDIDPYWDVSIENQRKAGDVFNRFIKSVGKDKKDSIITTAVMNSVFGKAFNVTNDDESILKALRNNKQLHAIAKRMIKRLDKMGYEF